MMRGVSVNTGNTSIAGLKFAHRRGASVKVTDHPVLTVMARIMNGTDSFPNVLQYAAGVTPSTGNDITDVDYVLSVVNGGPISYDKVTPSGIAGESVVSGDLVYLKETDGRWYKTDADTAATVNNVKMGIAQGSGSIGGLISGGVLTGGRDTTRSYTAGSVYYASNTAGGVSTSAGTVTKIIGVGDANNALIWGVFDRLALTQDQWNAAQGGGDFGSPSSPNKFITKTGAEDATNV